MQEESRLAEAASDVTPGFTVILLPVLGLLVMILGGLVVPPLILDQSQISLELVFVTSAVFAIVVLRLAGVSWERMQQSVMARMDAAMPAFFILLFIGVLIGTWMLSGTIPMLVYYGLTLVNPETFYLVAFLIPVVFSSLTGTSYGSAGTIGVVLISIASAMNADLGVTAGAIIGGAYFGDKLSPLSDTTNLAAIACDVDLYGHIQSMLYTTVPSAMIAACVFTYLGMATELAAVPEQVEIDQLMAGISGLFEFSWLLLLPPLIVLTGSLMRQPALPTLLVSIFAAAVLAVLMQPYSVFELGAAVRGGFSLDAMAPQIEQTEGLAALMNRGGVYSMAEPIFIAFFVFFYVGVVDAVSAIPRVIRALLTWSRSVTSTALTALFATGAVNALTSNQYATSFIVGDAFRRQFDERGIDRRVLSRALEDYGTMLESLVPWTTTTLFMVATLGVAWEDYVRWQILSLANLAVAPLLLALGVGMFKSAKRVDHSA